MAVKPQDLFAFESDGELAAQFDAYKGVLNKSLDRPMQPYELGAGIGPSQHPLMELQGQLDNPEVVKALGADVLESVKAQLSSPDVIKDLTLTSPLSTGYVLYDLYTPSLKLYPKMTPLRNRVARVKGVGTAHQFKRITGISGSGTGGLGLVRPGITDATTTNFGSLAYGRGPKMQYAGDEVSVPYKQFSMSDSVPWSNQFSAAGFEDMRQLSQTSLLYASMLAEERMILGGRGTSAGFAGALAAPTGVSVAARSKAGSESGISGITTNIYVYVTAESTWGESVLSSVATVAVTNTTQVAEVTVTGVPAGATGLRVYVGTGASQPADSTFRFHTRSGSNVIVIDGAIATTGRTAANVTSDGDTSAAATDYDGMLTYCAGSQAGYVNRINGTLNAANPGSEFFTAFAAMWDSVKADPDEIFANGNDRKQLSDLLKTSSSSNYRITIQNTPDAHTAQLGALVNGLQNEVTGKMVDVTVHPWLNQGIMPIISWSMPIPDTDVSNIWEVRGPQDYLGIQWPVLQFAYESSSYWYNSLICRAPGWQGAITGIKKA